MDQDKKELNKDRSHSRLRWLLWLIAIQMVLTPPWPFFKSWNVNILGFPPWAFYCFVATVVFGVTVGLLLQFAWDIFAGQEAGDDG